jgi:ankyrin repeat protein
MLNAELILMNLNPERQNGREIASCTAIADTNCCFGSLVYKISKETTVEEFKAKASQIKGYACEKGGYGGVMAICRAAIQGNLPLVLHILETTQGKFLDHGSETGKIPLHFAASCPDKRISFEIAQTLISYGTNVNVATSEMRTPISYAIEASNDPLVYLLLQHGAIPPRLNQLSSKGQKVLRTASRKLHREREKITLINTLFYKEASLESENKMLPKMPKELFQKIYNIYFTNFMHVIFDDF